MISKPVLSHFKKGLLNSTILSVKTLCTERHQESEIASDMREGICIKNNFRMASVWCFYKSALTANDK